MRKRIRKAGSRPRSRRRTPRIPDVMRDSDTEEQLADLTKAKRLLIEFERTGDAMTTAWDKMVQSDPELTALAAWLKKPGRAKKLQAWLDSIKFSYKQLGI